MLKSALAFVNARPKPLALYLFSRDAAATERVLRGTTAGGTIVNHVICHLANPDLPFGGVGESGQGSYHGLAGFRAFSHERAVLHAGKWSLAPLYYPPYGPRMRRVADLCFNCKQCQIECPAAIPGCQRLRLPRPKEISSHPHDRHVRFLSCNRWS